MSQKEIPLPHPDEIQNKYATYLYMAHSNDKDAALFQKAYELGFANGYKVAQQEGEG